jgi:uncharacterized protein
MKIHLKQIPEQGLHIEGEAPASILDLGEESLARPVGPVTYSLDLGLSDGGLFATGTVGVDLEMECGSCLEKFIYPLRVDDFAMQMELKGPETVDLTEQVREDILLALPPYPHCDVNGQKVCKGPEREVLESQVEAKPTWAELDKLKLKTKI